MLVKRGPALKNALLNGTWPGSPLSRYQRAARTRTPGNTSDLRGQTELIIWQRSRWGGGEARNNYRSPLRRTPAVSTRATTIQGGSSYFDKNIRTFFDADVAPSQKKTKTKKKEIRPPSPSPKGELRRTRSQLSPLIFRGEFLLVGKFRSARTQTPDLRDV